MPRPDVVDLLGSPDPVAAFEAARRDGRRLALQTSGTAGTVRTIVRSTGSWVDSFHHVSELVGLDRSSRVWVPGPLTATMNLFAAVHARWAGADLVDGSAAPTHAHLTPSTLRRELADRPDRLAGVHLVVAGDRLDRSTYLEARAAGARVSHYYGAAELSFVAWGAHDGDLRAFPRVEVESRSGELWVRSPYLCEGYLEPGTEARRDNDWMSVGDRGEVTEGKVVVHGRAGGITTGGATVIVADVERALRTEASGEVVVVGIPHPDLGQVVVAAVIDASDVQRLRGVSRRLLSPAQQPRRWVRVDAFPLTSAGKIDRTALAAIVLEGSSR